MWIVVSHSKSSNDYFKISFISFNLTPILFLSEVDRYGKLWRQFPQRKTNSRTLCCSFFLAKIFDWNYLHLDSESVNKKYSCFGSSIGKTGVTYSQFDGFVWLKYYNRSTYLHSKTNVRQQTCSSSFLCKKLWSLSLNFLFSQIFRLSFTGTINSSSINSNFQFHLKRWANRWWCKISNQDWLTFWISTQR